MPVRKLREYLDHHRVKYVSIRHSPAFTAQEIAASAHVPGKKLAKSVVLKFDGVMALAALPASYQVDLDLLGSLTGSKSIEIASESEFKDLFPDCEVGAMPPFGNLYGLATYVADALADDREIVFNAGSHTELIRMAYRDFERLAEPLVLHFASKVA